MAGLEVIQTLKEMGAKPALPIVIAAFCNEEAFLYSPDMMGSLFTPAVSPLRLHCLMSGRTGRFSGAFSRDWVCRRRSQAF